MGSIKGGGSAWELVKARGENHTKPARIAGELKKE